MRLPGQGYEKVTWKGVRLPGQRYEKVTWREV